VTNSTTPGVLSSAAASYASYTADGVASTYAIPFTYNSKSDITVYVNGASVSFTFLTSSTIQTTVVPPSSAKVVIQRNTPVDSPLVDFSNTAPIKAQDTNKVVGQLLGLVQEIGDGFQTAGEQLANKGEPGGYVPLGEDGLIDGSFLPDQSAAAASAAAAATSATAANASATAAAGSATAAATSATAAATAATAAQAADTDAAAQSIASAASATNAANANTAAQAAATTATNAANAAVNGVNYYATLAALNADLVPAANVGARVVADTTLANNGFYKKVGATGTGSWSFIGTDPVAAEAVLRATGDTTTLNTVKRYAREDALPLPGFSLNFFDKWRNSIGGITTAGLFLIQKGFFNVLNAASAQFTRLYLDTAAVVKNKLPAGFRFAVPDKFGNITGGCASDGVWEFGNIRLVKVNGQSVGILVNNTPGMIPYLPATYVLIPIYGQSLSLGVQAAATTLANVYNALKLNATWTGSAWSYTGLGGLHENADYNNTGNVRETPSSGCAKALLDLLQAENGINVSTNTLTPVMLNPGVVGSPIAGLIKGTPAYTQFMAAIAAVVGFVNAAGGTVVVPGYGWAQVEADYNLLTSAVSYKTTKKQLRLDLDTDIKLLTGQTQDVYCITYQCDSHIEHGSVSPYLAIALYELAAGEDPHFTMGPVMYTMPHFTDGIHSTPAGYKTMGAYYGRGIKRVCFDGVAPTKAFLSIKSFQAQGNVFQITCNVPQLPLVIDTTQVPANTNYGFKFRNPSTFADLGTHIAVSVSRDKIIGVCTDGSGNPVAVAGKLLTWGWDNAAGTSTPTSRPVVNVRDSSGDSFTFDGGFFTARLDHWLPIGQHQY
jgi:hypothetical protein